MSVEVQWVRYGRPAAEKLQATIRRAKAGEPLAPVTIVVPSNYVGVATRRLLASGSLGPLCDKGIGVAAVSFVTVYRLAELLGSTRLAGGGRRPVSTPVIAAALRAALAKKPGIFAPVAAHAATETALIAAYRELRDLSDGALDALARRSDRAADVVRLHRTARVTLESAFYDEEDLLDSAAEVLRHDAAAARRLGTVIVYLPEQLSRHGGELLRAVAASNDLVVLAGTTGEARADAEVIRSVRRIKEGAEVSHPGPGDSLDIVGRGRTQIVTVSDCDEEVRAAVRVIVDAARAGVRLDRIAILHTSPSPYARLAEEQLTAAGISLNGAALMPLTDRVVGRTLLGLLALPEGGFRREDVFAWLAGGHLRHDGRPIGVPGWERLSREAGVVAGRADWDLRLALLADAKDERAVEAEKDGDAPPWRVASLRTEAARARALRAFVLGLIDDLADAAAQPRPWGVRVGWARRELAGLFGDERKRAPWPLVEQKAADRVDRALDRLSCLDAVEKSVDLDVFTRSLELELETDLGRVGRMGDGVLVGSVGMGVGLDLDLVIVLGLAEGLFPSPTHDDSLLPDHERSSTHDELPLRAHRVERQHRQLLAALAGAARQVLCIPRGDLRRNIERVPSRWILQIAGAITGEPWSSEDLFGAHGDGAHGDGAQGDGAHGDGAQGDWLTHVASFDGGIRQSGLPATEQEHRLRALMAQGSTRLPTTVLVATGDATLGAGAEVVAARTSDHFTRFDGNLSGVTTPSPAERVTSATRLERWASCPHAYLLHDILGVDEVENPEDELQITARDRGSLVHQALEDFIAEVLQDASVGDRDAYAPWSASDRTRMVEIAEAVCGRYEAKGLTGRPIFWRQDKKRIVADLLRFLDEDNAHRGAHASRPLEAELAFGLPGSDLGTVALDLPDGRQVDFRGKADRVDIGRDGTLHVVDYKTGKADDYADLSENNPDAQGRHLQLAVYGQAARLRQGTPDAEVRAEYWFVSSRGRFTRSGYPITPAVLTHIGQTLGAMVGGIEAGVFPQYPTASTTNPWVECAFCDPDGLGVSELRRSFERKAADPAMTAFVDFVAAFDETPSDAGNPADGLYVIGQPSDD
jgi:hypothetical protein